jgi:hypothetical protein
MSIYDTMSTKNLREAFAQHREDAATVSIRYNMLLAGLQELIRVESLGADEYGITAWELEQLIERVKTWQREQSRQEA